MAHADMDSTAGNLPREVPIPKAKVAKPKKPQTPDIVAKGKVRECQTKITEIKGLQRKVSTSPLLCLGTL